jgi:hypothetical protein
MKKTKMNIHRHGELILKQVRSIPRDATVVESAKSIIVAHSESGHHHVLSAASPIQMFGLGDLSFLNIPEDSRLFHQKQGDETHGTQIIAKGFYERIIKKSYSYAEKVMKNVVD